MTPITATTTPAPVLRPMAFCSDPDRITLVTGGAGFLGSHLCARLLDMGHRVIAVDNLSTGRRSNVAHLEQTGRFELIEHDIIAPVEIDGQIGAIYNLACPASPPKYQRDPVHTFRTSIDGAQNMLDLALKHDARILQASTSEVYGDPELSPQPESYCGAVNTYGPRACYDEGKRGAETLFYEYAHRFGADTRIARIFNTYGPRMDAEDGRVVSNFVVQALCGQDITIYGSGRQTRSFCYVDDLIEGLIRLMAADIGFWRACQSGQSARIHRAGTGTAGAGQDAIELATALPAGAARRSAPAPPLYHAGADGAGLAADRQPERRA